MKPSGRDLHIPGKDPADISVCKSWKGLGDVYLVFLRVRRHLRFEDG